MILITMSCNSFFSKSNLMSQLARISTSFIRNPPASLNRHGSARYHGLPTDVLKKSNPWKISRFTPSSLPCATSKDNEAGTRKGKDDEVMIFKGRMMILRLVLDDDDPQNHIIDSLAIFRMALNMWKHFRPDFELHYGYEDLKVPPTLPRLSVEATSKKISVPHAALSILAFLQEFDDPEVADQVLLSALQTWKNLMWGIEVQCANKYKHDDVKKKKKPIPLAVTWWLKAYKMLIYVAWEIFTPLLHKIDDAEVKPLSYKQGSRGPAEADELLAKAGYMQTHGYVWIPPTL